MSVNSRNVMISRSAAGARRKSLRSVSSRDGMAAVVGVDEESNRWDLRDWQVSVDSRVEEARRAGRGASRAAGTDPCGKDSCEMRLTEQSTNYRTGYRGLHRAHQHFGT